MISPNFVKSEAKRVDAACMWWFRDPKWRERYRCYWQREGADNAANRLVGTCTFILICQFSFIGIDRIAFPSEFPLFLAFRLSANLAVIYVLFRSRLSHPNESQIGVACLIAIEILAMIFVTGEPDSVYFAGLILVLVGMPVLQPITAPGSLLVSIVCLGGFALCAALHPKGINPRTFLIEMIFVAAASLESAFSCRALTSGRVVDFERRRELEAARDELASLDDAKNRFTANIHHELRTPLTLLLAPLDSMRAGDFGRLPEDLTNVLETMHSNGSRLLRLINNLLDLSKIESARYVLELTRFDLTQIAKEILDGALPLANKKNIEMSFQSTPAHIAVTADKSALEKVITNLIGNALKFSGEGDVIELNIAAKIGNVVEIKVSDTGIGLAESDFEKVFDRFAQVDVSPTRRHEGTGIGLSLSRELVELHDGSIRVESEGPNQGSTFIASIPCLDETSGLVEADRADSEETEPSYFDGDFSDDLEPALVSPGDSSKTEAHILVVDDNPDMRRIISLFLGREFSVETASDGAKALDAIRARPPLLVLTDLMMPIMSGIELCKVLKEDPMTADIPVILLTSKAESEMKVEGLEIGAEDYITKPFHPRELLARVRSLANVHSLQRSLEAQNRTLSVALDDLKKTQVQLVNAERMAAVGELAAGIAHEANNPINFALNAATALASCVREMCGYGAEDGGASLEELSSDVLELTKIVQDGLQRTSTLVCNLRDFSSPSATSVDIRECLESTLLLMKHSLEDESVTASVRIPRTISTVSADRSAVGQIFLNLIKNAIESTRRRPLSIEITGKTDGEFAAIRVSDDGPGVPPQALDRLFEPFFTTKGAGEGSGLGLSICRKIAEDYGGSLSLAENSTAGATFELRLPISPRGNHRA